jgi:hypothetical protein
MDDVDNLDSLNTGEVRTQYDASILAGVIGLAALILIGMAGAVIVWAAMSGAVRP